MCFHKASLKLTNITNTINNTTSITIRTAKCETTQLDLLTNYINKRIPHTAVTNPVPESWNTISDDMPQAYQLGP